MRKLLFILCFGIAYYTAAQEPAIKTDKDTIAGVEDKKDHPLSSGYYPIGFFDIDLKTLIKLNNYEGLRLGIGGLTNEKLFENYKLGGYFAYGFKDKTSKYSLGGTARVNKEKKAWVSVYYADDVKEIGTFDYLTDARVYSIFEPRLVNITQFYKYRKWYANIAAELSPKILGKVRVEHSNVDNIENSYYINDGIP